MNLIVENKVQCSIFLDYYKLQGMQPTLIEFSLWCIRLQLLRVKGFFFVKFNKDIVFYKIYPETNIYYLANK